MINTSAINMELINLSINNHGFSESTIQIINNFSNDILSGKS